VVRQADTLRTVNADQRERYVEMGIDPQRIEVINTPINLGRFLEPPEPGRVAVLRAQLDIPPESQVILWVGRPAARNQKRLDDLLEAFALVRGRLPASVLVIVGDMRGASYVRHQVERLGLSEAVRLPDGVPHAELPTYFALCDVFALSSVYEGMPKVAAEAAASGVPVVATRVPGIEDAVLDGESGLLCERENPVDLADKLVTLLGDPVRAGEMGQRAREYARERFDRERTMQAIVGLWEQAAAERGGR
jgi:glycosyltransferase involved in cell wall biosynthesis